MSERDSVSVAAQAGTAGNEGLIATQGITGAIIEVSDLAGARSFFEAILADSPGEWTDHGTSLVYQRGEQRIELSQQTQPRDFGYVGQHIALHVSHARLETIADELQRAGSKVNWWREDHPLERVVTVYAQDPNGAIVQLVANDGAPLLAHIGIPVFDLRLAEPFYTHVLGGQLDYYHGFRTEDRVQAKAWDEGRDPCAPWTRRKIETYTLHEMVALPNPQLFFTLGTSRLAVLLANKHVQEPPEEQHKGTPRFVARTDQTPTEVMDQLAHATLSEIPWRQSVGIPFEREGSSIFLRDPFGNFIEVECRAE